MLYKISRLHKLTRIYNLKKKKKRNSSEKCYNNSIKEAKLDAQHPIHRLRAENGLKAQKLNSNCDNLKTQAHHLIHRLSPKNYLKAQNWNLNSNNL